MTLACVLRSGGDYNAEWVRKLAAGLRAQVPGAELVCLTDLVNPPTLEGVTWKLLVHDWPGWFAKLELFRPGVFNGPVLYFDLDTLVLGDLGPLVEFVRGLPDDAFGVLSDFYHPERAQSAVMAWNPGPLSEEVYFRWDRMPPEGHEAWWSDQPFIDDARRDQFRFQAHAPKNYFASFKVHARSGPPEGCAVLCFHGTPRPDDPSAGWAHDAWAAL